MALVVPRKGAEFITRGLSSPQHMEVPTGRRQFFHGIAVKPTLHLERLSHLLATLKNKHTHQWMVHHGV